MRNSAISEEQGMRYKKRRAWVKSSVKASVGIRIYIEIW